MTTTFTSNTRSGLSAVRLSVKSAPSACSPQLASAPSSSSSSLSLASLPHQHYQRTVLIPSDLKCCDPWNQHHLSYPLASPLPFLNPRLVFRLTCSPPFSNWRASGLGKWLGLSWVLVGGEVAGKSARQVGGWMGAKWGRGQNIIVWSANWQTCSRHLLNCAHSFHCYNLAGFVNLNLDGMESFQITKLSDQLIIISKRSLATSGSTLDPWSPITNGKRWDNDQSAVSQSTLNGRSHNGAAHNNHRGLCQTHRHHHGVHHHHGYPANSHMMSLSVIIMVGISQWQAQHYWW